MDWGSALSRDLTLRSSGQPKGCAFRLPLTSNVRPQGTLCCEPPQFSVARARPGCSAASLHVSSSHDTGLRPGVPSGVQSHGSGRSSSGRHPALRKPRLHCSRCWRQRLHGSLGRHFRNHRCCWQHRLLVRESVSMPKGSVAFRVTGMGRRVGGAIHRLQLPLGYRVRSLSVRPNPSIEGMPKRLRLLRPPHVKLQGLPHLSSKFKP